MIVHPVDFPLGSLAARKSTGWTIERTAETTPRAWFDGGADWHGDRGFADSVAYVHKFLIENEPFDGFFAFSSGATLAVAIVALLMKGTQHSDRNFPFHPRLQKPRCALHFPPCVWKVAIRRLILLMPLASHCQPHSPPCMLSAKMIPLSRSLRPSLWRRCA